MVARYESSEHRTYYPRICIIFVWRGKVPDRIGCPGSRLKEVRQEAITRYVSVGGVVARSPMADGPTARGCRRARVTSSVSCSNASLAFRCPGTMYS